MSRPVVRSPTDPLPANRSASPDSASFQDLFSAHAACYARARPTYPPELFSYIAGLAPARERAWDCGTGSGQAAVALADHFQHVIATDASGEQLAHATPHPRVEYRQALAESADFAPASVDLVTAAQALHWFNFDPFFANVRRVLKPRGVAAVWGYLLCSVNPRIDAVCIHLCDDITGPYWLPGRKHVDARYETIPFPFDELRPTPEFACRVEWTLPQYLDYLGSWSATQKYIEKNGRDPRDEVSTDLAAVWGDAATTRTVTWPIFLRVGRVNSA